MVLNMIQVWFHFDEIDIICKVFHSRVESYENMVRVVMKSGKIDGVEHEAEQALILSGVVHFDIVFTRICY